MPAVHSFLCRDFGIERIRPELLRLNDDALAKAKLGHQLKSR